MKKACGPLRRNASLSDPLMQGLPTRPSGGCEIDTWDAVSGLGRFLSCYGRERLSLETPFASHIIVSP
jgi:hypothetical protein